MLAEFHNLTKSAFNSIVIVDKKNCANIYYCNVYKSENDCYMNCINPFKHQALCGNSIC